MCPKDKTGPQSSHQTQALYWLAHYEKIGWENPPPPTEESSSVNGSPDSNGPPGGLSPSDQDAPDTAPSTMNTSEGGVRMVRRHNGRFTISAGLLTHLKGLESGTFIVLSGVGSAGAHTVTLSCELTRAQWHQLERALIMPGGTGTVAVRFEPTTPNLVPSIT